MQLSHVVRILSHWNTLACLQSTKNKTPALVFFFEGKFFGAKTVLCVVDVFYLALSPHISSIYLVHVSVAYKEKIGPWRRFENINCDLLLPWSNIFLYQLIVLWVLFANSYQSLLEGTLVISHRLIKRPTLNTLQHQTYVGFTVNPKRRLRQHNGEIINGAKRTSKKRPWYVLTFFS